MFDILLSLALAGATQAGPTSPPALPAGCEAQAAGAACIAGSWKGTFAGSDWTLEYVQAPGGGWSARYQTTRTNRWHDMPAVTVADRTVRAAIASQPALTFVLTPDPGAQTMRGVIEVADGPRIPFTVDRIR